MEIKHLEWDSNFFKRKIAKIHIKDLSKTDELTANFNWLITNSYDLVYVFCSTTISKQIQSKFNGSLIDIKIVYKKCISKSSGHKQKEIHEWSNSFNLNMLYELGMKSGVYSRYKKDNKFSNQEFRNLYRTWIENSINRSFADNVFIYIDNSKNLVGFATLKITNSIGTIGLIAVDEAVRGNRIGSKLIEHIEEYLYRKNITELHVATQKDNTAACNFYSKNGMTIHSITNIYHFWFK